MEKDLLNQIQELLQKIEEPLTLTEASAFVKLKPPTLYQLAQQGKIPATKKRRKWYFYKSELNNWLKSDKIQNSNL